MSTIRSRKTLNLASPRDSSPWSLIQDRQSRIGSVNGALIIDKPESMTSHDVIARVRRIIGERRVGHTGTLDPFATGVLLVLVGRATRLAQFLSGAEKEYQAVIRLGVSTDTGDITGQPIIRDQSQRTLDFSPEEIEAALASLRGEIEQTPPMYSAKKVRGRKLYELAREGVEVERKPVTVTILEFETLSGEVPASSENGFVDLPVRVVCSAGTYVRTLAENFGGHMGTGAHLVELRRTRAGKFGIERAVPLDRLAELAQNSSVQEVLILPDEVLGHLPSVELSSAEAAGVLHGIDVRVNETQEELWLPEQPVRLRNNQGELIAVGKFDEAQKHIHPTVVIGDSG